MKKKYFETQSQMQEFIDSIDWGHAFVREIYARSPTYKTIDGNFTVNPDRPLDLVILIITDDKKNPGVVFYFEEAQLLELSTSSDVKLTGIIDNDRLGHKIIRVSFDSEHWIVATKLSFRLLGDEVLGDRSNITTKTDLEFDEVSD